MDVVEDEQWRCKEQPSELTVIPSRRTERFEVSRKMQQDKLILSKHGRFVKKEILMLFKL